MFTIGAPPRTHRPREKEIMINRRMTLGLTAAATAITLGALGSIAQQAPPPEAAASLQDEALAPQEGPLSMRQVAAVLGEHRLGLQRCYERAYRTNPALQGTLELEWVIEADGTVASVHALSDTLQKPDVSSCLQGQIEQLTFPSRGGVYMVSYPFVFQGS